MKLPDNLNPNDVIGRDGIFFRNPSNIDVRNNSSDQSKIVSALTNKGRKRNTEIFKYGEKDVPHTMPGILKIRELTVDALEKLFGNMMRLRPNILKVHLNLGEYKSLRPILDRKVQFVGGSEPRWPTDLAKDMAALFADKKLMVVNFIYTIHNADVGNFSSTCDAYGVSEEEYKNNKLFKPGLLIEYFPNI